MHTHNILKPHISPTMAKTKRPARGSKGGKGGGGGTAGIEYTIRDEDTIDKLKDKIRNLEDKASDVNYLQQHVLELEKENRQVRKMARNGNIMKFQENEVALIVEMTKRLIYPKCQYIRIENKLTRVMGILSTKQTLSKEQRVEFNMNFRDVILRTINQMRNSSVQSMRRMYKSKYL